MPIQLSSTIEATGIITFWSLASHSVRDQLTDALSAIDPKLAKSVPPERDLRTGLVADALHEMFSGRDGFVVYPLKRGKGWVVKQEVPTDDDVEYRYVCHVNVEDYKDVNGDPFQRVVIKRGYTIELHDRLMEAIDRQRGLAPAHQVSEMLIGLLKEMPGIVTLRPSGGIYVLTDAPSQQLWNKVADAVLNCAVAGRTNKVYRIDYRINEGSIEAIRDALLDEVAQFCASLNAEIFEPDPEKQLGSRALKNRQKQAERMLDRVEHLERALSTRLQDCKDMVDTVKTAAAQASMLSAVTV